MSVQSFVLFVHVLGVVLLFAAIGAEGVLGAQISAARSAEEARPAAAVSRRLPAVFAIAEVLLLGSGIYLMVQLARAGLPIGWVVVALVAFLLVGVYSSVMGSRTEKLLVPLLQTPGPWADDTRARVRALPARSVSLRGACAAVAILALMVFEPATWAAVVVLVVAVALSQAGVLGLRRTGPALATPPTAPAPAGQPETTP